MITLTRLTTSQTTMIQYLPHPLWICGERCPPIFRSLSRSLAHCFATILENSRAKCVCKG